MNETSLEVQVPQVKKINSALRRYAKSWSVLYYVNGKLREKSCNTKLILEARAIRDKFFSDLLTAGATLKPSHRGSTRKDPHHGSST